LRLNHIRVAPHFMALLDGVHDLCIIAWHSYGGYMDKFEYNDRDWQ
jgi:hypothetical protein